MTLPVLDPDLSALLRAELEPRLQGELRTGRHDRLLYATDASLYQVEPLAVVLPRSIADVLETLQFAARRALPVLPRGGGTALAGQTVNRAIVIDTSRYLTRIGALDHDARRISVEPGVVLDQLNLALAPDHRFGPDVATSTHATLGGMIGNNSAGANSVIYGRTVEHVHALDVALFDGTRLRLEAGAAERDDRVRDLTRRVVDVVTPIADEIDRRFPHTRRRVDGYNLDLVLAQIRASTPGTFDAVNLAHLVCGSEGTLAFTLGADLGVVEAPRERGLVIAAFTGVEAALDAVVPVLELGPAAIELVDDIIIELAAANREHRPAVDLLPRPGGVTPRAVLYIEFFGRTPQEIDAAFDRLRALLPGAALATHRDPAAISAAWRLRKAGEPLLHGQPGARKPVTFVEDTAVEPTQLPKFVRAFRGILERHGTYASYYAHASVGCLHIRPLIALADPGDRTRMTRIMEEVTDLVLEFGGALSGEHGDGRLRTPMLERFFGPIIVQAFRDVKSIFDPRGLLNPGNIVEATPLTDHWRARPGAGDAQRDAVTPEVRTWFRYEREHGFAGAVEMCNGAGMCRRTSGGTMCPSYRATLDERHATRGRGNALRLAITGQSVAERWDDPETLETLDLCLSCKACKSECPSNVDVARLKSEYLAHSFAARGGVPLGVRLLADFRTAARIGAAAPRVARAIAGSALGRRLLRRGFGIDERRTLPPVARPMWRDPTIRAAARGAGPTVLLFADCFTAFGEPEIGRAAAQVLRALGFRVVVPRTGCCARPHLSLGDLERATRTAGATLDVLDECARRESAVAVLGCEPSCVSAMLDDWPDLARLDRTRAERLAAMTLTVEDFVDRAWEATPLDVTRPHEGALLLHGHCHQKALWSTGPTERLLRRVSAGDVVPLDTGCCGMAGAFGLTADHYDVSVAVAETSLLPALRAREGTVVAPGTSCRHQVRDLAHRAAVHPIEVVAGATSVGRA